MTRRLKCPAADPSVRRDRGTTFIEVLVAIVLLGVLGVGVLTAARTSIIGTRIERDHARAFQWLQSADGVLQASPRVSCNFDPVLDAPYTSGEEKVRMEYEKRIRSQVVKPAGWTDSQITVVAPVLVWDGSQYRNPATAPKSCYDADKFFLQLVTIRVTNLDGQIIETNQVVKRV